MRHSRIGSWHSKPFNNFTLSLSSGICSGVNARLIVDANGRRRDAHRVDHGRRQGRDTSQRKGPSNLTRLGDLLAEPDDAIEWIIAERFSYGSVNLLAGKPKGGKSTTARYLALCVATGTPFLG